MTDSDSATSEPQAEASEDRNVGRTLREAREAQGLTIEEIATELRMETRLLQALEGSRFDELGAPVFAKGYLKQYGTRLGLDYRDLLADYYQVVGSTEVQIAPSRSIKLRDERQITVWIIAALAIALLAVFLFVWWLDEPMLASGSGGEPVGGTARETDLPSPVAIAAPTDRAETARPAAGGPQTPADAAVTGAALADTAAADAALAARPAALDANTGNPVSQQPQARNPADAEPDAGDAVPVRDTSAAATLSRTGEPAAGAAIGSRPAQNATAAPASTAAAAVPDGPHIDVALVFAEDCWTEITDANGQRSFYGLGQAGSRASFAAAAPVRFFLGNADGVDITVDGQRYDIPRSARDGNLARFVVDAAD